MGPVPHRRGRGGDSLELGLGITSGSRKRFEGRRRWRVEGGAAGDNRMGGVGDGGVAAVVGGEVV